MFIAAAAAAASGGGGGVLIVWEGGGEVWKGIALKYNIIFIIFIYNVIRFFFSNFLFKH